MKFKMALSGLFALALSSVVEASAENSYAISESKPITPKMPADIPTSPINPPIRRTNIFDVMIRPANRQQRRHGVELG